MNLPFLNPVPQLRLSICKKIQRSWRLAAPLALGLFAAAALLFAFSAASIRTAKAGVEPSQPPEYPLSGTDWYVSKGGNDGWSCQTWTFACKTIQAAVDKADNCCRLNKEDLQ
jgi:hypothetical protein